MQAKKRQKNTPLAAREEKVTKETVASAVGEMPDENTDIHIADKRQAASNDTQPLDIADAFLANDTVSQAAPAEETPVSPFGFGPYPQLPDGWSENTFPAASAEPELQKRVRIKLISKGINAVGTSMENGNVYPIIKGTAYVEWKSYWRPTGQVR